MTLEAGKDKLSIVRPQDVNVYKFMPDVLSLHQSCYLRHAAQPLIGYIRNHQHASMGCKMGERTAIMFDPFVRSSYKTCNVALMKSLQRRCENAVLNGLACVVANGS
jgi:hypothetical protein